jgi:ribosome-associated protein
MKQEFQIRGEFIQLDQLLKATGMTSSGGMAHAVTSEGKVTVDGVVETRKRAKLRAGQCVRYLEQEIVLSGAPGSEIMAPPEVA